MHDMPPKTLVRILIIAEISMFALSCALNSILESTLPVPLSAYDAAPKEYPSWLYAVVYVGLGVPTLILALTSHIGLFFFWRPARVLYLVGGISILFMVVLDGPAVRTGWEGMFDYLSAVIYGSILGLIYFSPLRDLYAKKQPNKSLQATASAAARSN
jgi:hypothetical protein